VGGGGRVVAAFARKMEARMGNGLLTTSEVYVSKTNLELLSIQNATTHSTYYRLIQEVENKCKKLQSTKEACEIYFDKLLVVQFSILVKNAP
jgi:hypothetical protein